LDKTQRLPTAGAGVAALPAGQPELPRIGVNLAGHQLPPCVTARLAWPEARAAPPNQAQPPNTAKALETDLARQRAELAQYSGDYEARIISSSDREQELGRIPNADPAKRGSGNGSGNGNGRSRTLARNGG
jgi:hypothetical protein